ncbi:MAG: hypothetical protein R3D67_09520 [Hyphomicrobiaceae bacterium]
MLELNGDNGLGRLMKALTDYSSVLVTVAAVLAIIVLAKRLLSGSSPRGGRHRIGRIVTDAFTTNWQLTLLATTAFVLSLASGWTTWDGMRNFTGEPVLSFMVTFGIQGVMLIIAWLIGESFAAGMQRRERRPGQKRGGTWGQIEPFVGMAVGALCALGLLTALANALGAFDDFSAASHGQMGWGRFADKALYLGVGLLLLATLLINQKSDVIHPYLQSLRVMAKNAVLWVMFLACMATSVFFSFDSLFSSIFPKAERKRAADIRAARQVAGVVADIGVLAQRRQGEEQELLFKSDGWAAFARNLDALSRASEGADREIERYFVDKMEQRRSAIAEQQERISSAKSGQAGLISRKATLTDELSRLKGERPALAADLAEKKSELDNRAKGIDAKRVEVMAEERGAEGTLKVGRGPAYRQRKAELDQLQDAFKIQEERVRDSQKRLSTTDTRIAQIGRELAAVDGDIAKLKGEAETAEQRISVAESVKSGDDGMPKVDPARVRVAFERAHNEFRRLPTMENLNALALQCSQLHSAMISAPATKDRVRDIDCDPKQATEAAARVFALNAGLVKFARTCSGGDKLPVAGGTDAMLDFGRRCLQDSGLPSRDSGEMAAKISGIDLNRDDKAHRFVVTWNAFVDGNRLAYLALAIAIAIDSLVFMSGLFGANALRSPLTEIEDRGEMTADQLEATIDATLGETAHPRATLSALLSAMHPVHNHAYDGFTSELILDERDPLADEMRQVLVAGSVIGAVRRVGEGRSQYLIHSGLARYLAVAQRKPWVVKPADVERKELVNVVGVALHPDPPHNAEIVLSYLHPISDSVRFSAETYPFRDIVDPQHRNLMMKTLGAGATVPGSVERENDNGRYLVSTHFYKTLLLMRAAAIPAFRGRQYRADEPGRLADPHDGNAGSGGKVRELHSDTIPQLPDHTIRQAADDGRAGERPHDTMERDATVAGPSVPAPLGPSSTAGTPPPPLPVAAKAANHATDGSGPSGQVSSQMASRIRADIINHGLYPWDDREIDNAFRSSDAGLVDRAIRNLIEREPYLGKRVATDLDEMLLLVDEAYQQLNVDHNRDSKYTEVLESEVDKIKRYLPVLMLTNGGPYEQIADLARAQLNERAEILEEQAGGGKLSEQEETVLRNLGDHIHQLRSVPKNVIDRHKRVAAILDGFSESAASDPWPVGLGEQRRSRPLS